MITLTTLSPSVPMTRLQRSATYLMIVSGLLIAAGSLLPWFSLFAGLQPYRGVSGLYGQLVLIGGVASVVTGLFLVRGTRQVLRYGALALGAALSVFTVWLLVGLMSTYERLLENPMYVARLEPGLFLAVAGAALLTFAALASAPRSAAMRSR